MRNSPMKANRPSDYCGYYDPAGAGSLEGTSSRSLSESLVPLYSTTPSAIAGRLRKVQSNSFKTSSKNMGDQLKLKPGQPLYPVGVLIATALPSISANRDGGGAGCPIPDN